MNSRRESIYTKLLTFFVCWAIPLAVIMATADSPARSTRETHHQAGEAVLQPGVPGENIATAIVIPSLPFQVTGSTIGFANDYDESCPYGPSAAPDVVYKYAPPVDMRVNIILCESLYDTKLFLYEDVYTPGSPIACNDDMCGTSGDRSKLSRLQMRAGHTYYIVVDGYDGAAGDYVLSVDEIPVLPPRGSVVVESKTVSPGDTAVTISVRLSNEEKVGSLVVPLVLREVTPGAYITSLRISFAERLASLTVLEGNVRNQYASADGSCKDGYAGGFRTITGTGDGPFAISASPIGVMFVRWTATDLFLDPGADTSGSLLLKVSVTGSTGEFEIDTTCTNPANHLIFVDTTKQIGHEIPISFTKGTIVIGHPVVSNLNDAGAGSLRAAIEKANSHAGPDTVTFAVTGTINLATPLPEIDDASGGAVLLGFSAPGAENPLTPAVILDGASCATGSALPIRSSGNKVEGLIFRNFNGAGAAVIGGTSNTITACRFYGNTGPGIDLGDDGITPNSPGNLINYPVLDSAFGTGLGIFTVFGTAPAGYRIELYTASKSGTTAYPPEATSHGPAYGFLDSTRVLPGGAFAFVSVQLPEWSQVTATATDPVGNTSELGFNRNLTPDPIQITAYSEPAPPGLEVLSLPSTSPTIQVRLISPVNSLGMVDSIGPSFNTFGHGSYDSLADWNYGGKPDVRLTVLHPDTGGYRLEYRLVGTPGSYPVGIAVGEHTVSKKITFTSTGQTISTSLDLRRANRGELNGDGAIDVFDVITLIEVVFGGRPMPDPPDVADVDCNGEPDVFDIIYLINYTFGGGTPPCV